MRFRSDPWSEGLSRMLRHVSSGGSRISPLSRVWVRMYPNANLDLTVAELKSVALARCVRRTY